jgi:hypothetical protein
VNIQCVSIAIHYKLCSGKHIEYITHLDGVTELYLTVPEVDSMNGLAKVRFVHYPFEDPPLTEFLYNYQPTAGGIAEYEVTRLLIDEVEISPFSAREEGFIKLVHGFTGI